MTEAWILFNNIQNSDLHSNENTFKWCVLTEGSELYLFYPKFTEPCLLSKKKKKFLCSAFIVVDFLGIALSSTSFAAFKSHALLSWEVRLCRGGGEKRVDTPRWGWRISPTLLAFFVHVSTYFEFFFHPPFTIKLSLNVWVSLFSKRWGEESLLLDLISPHYLVQNQIGSEVQIQYFRR